MACPFHDKTEHMNVICFCPGMSYRIIQQFGNRAAWNIQRAYCEGSYKTARYCPLYRMIEQLLARSQQRQQLQPVPMSRYPEEGKTLQVIRGKILPKNLPRKRREAGQDPRAGGPQ